MSKPRTPEDEDDDEVTEDCGDCECCCNVNPREEPLDFTSVIALVVLGIGIVLVSVGYLVPREHKLDHSRSARENEALGLYYADLAAKLDICIITGMVLVGLGGMTMSILLMIILCRGEMDYVSNRTQPYYGTGDNTRLIQMSEIGNVSPSR